MIKKSLNYSPKKIKKKFVRILSDHFGRPGPKKKNALPKKQTKTKN